MEYFGSWISQIVGFLNSLDKNKSIVDICYTINKFIDYLNNTKFHYRFWDKYK